MPNRRDFTRTLAAAGLTGLARPAAAQSGLMKLQVGTNAADDVTPLLWAKATGMFTKAGLDVDIQKLTSGSAVTAAVLGGSLDIGRSSLLPLISARSHDVPVQLIAPAELSVGEDPSAGIIVLKDGPVKSARDLNGSTMPSPSLKDYFWIADRAWIDANGGDSKTVKFIELPISAMLAAIEAGAADRDLDGILATGRLREDTRLPGQQIGLGRGPVFFDIGRGNEAGGAGDFIEAELGILERRVLDDHGLAGPERGGRGRRDRRFGNQSGAADDRCGCRECAVPARRAG